MNCGSARPVGALKKYMEAIWARAHISDLPPLRIRIYLSERTGGAVYIRTYEAHYAYLRSQIDRGPDICMPLLSPRRRAAFVVAFSQDKGTISDRRRWLCNHRPSTSRGSVFLRPRPRVRPRPSALRPSASGPSRTVRAGWPRPAGRGRAPGVLFHLPCEVSECRQLVPPTLSRSLVLSPSLLFSFSAAAPPLFSVRPGTIRRKSGLAHVGLLKRIPAASAYLGCN